MADRLTLDDLVENRTMSAEMAATLRAAVRARRSFLVFALPRLAGKSTVGRAILDNAGPRVPVLTLGVDSDDVGALVPRARGGYLYVQEISTYPVNAGYVWGAPVRHAFAAIADGTALSTALHADAVTEALDIVRQNDVPETDLGRLDVLVHIRSLGENWRAPTRRVVVGVHEVVPSPRRVTTRQLHRWDERRDRFEQLRASA